MMRGRRHERGFTLIESMVVIGIIGIVVAVSLPSLRRSTMRANMLETVHVFQQATAVSRINAIKRGIPVCLQVVTGSGRQHLSRFRAWFDANGNEVEDAGEEVVGVWQVRNADRWMFQDSTDHPMHVLNATGGGSIRGIVYLPSGMAITEAAGQPGIGEGAVEYFIYVDGRRWNTFRFSVFGGAGTVQVRMNIPGTSNWSDNFAYWEYY